MIPIEEKKEEKFYGYKDQEQLSRDPEDVVIYMMENGEYEDYANFPIKVYEFESISIAKNEETFARDILEDLLERLDNNYGDPDSNGTKPTEDMKRASLELAKVMLKDYQSWTCEETGKVIEFSKEQAEKICGR